MKLDQVARPGMMLSQAWPESRAKEGETLRALCFAVENGFFKAVQTVEIPFAGERKAIAKVLGDSGIQLTYCLARVLNDNKLNLSDFDGGNRLKSCGKILECIEQALEAGASSVTLTSGRCPLHESGRKRALAYLTESLFKICEESHKSSGIKIVIEPLDYYAHKKNTLGTTTEAVEICRLLKKYGADLYLCIDTAHAALNGENPVEAACLAKDYMAEFHFCNCVTDSGHSLYGDYHIPFGEPGILGVKEMAAIMSGLTGQGYLNENCGQSIFCEVLKGKDDNSEMLVGYCRDIMEKAWAMSVGLRGRGHDT